MSLEALKTYQVQYQITMVDGASEGLQGLAKIAQQIEGPLKQASEAIRIIGREYTALQSNLAQSVRMEPMVDLARAKESFDKLTSMARVAATDIQTVMSNAMNGVKSKVNAKLAERGTSDLAKLYKINSEKIKGANEKSVAILENENHEIVKCLQERGTSVKRELLKIENEKKAITAANTKAAQKAAALGEATHPYKELASQSKKLSSVANAIKRINENVNAFAPKKKNRSITIDANISPAVSKINTLLATIRESTAALPVTIIEAGKAAKQAGKSISSITGQATKAGLASAKLAASEKPVASMDKILAGQKAPASEKKESTKKVKSSISSSVEQMNALATKMEALAKNKTVEFKAAFSGNGTISALTESLSKLQELANGKPIMLKMKLFNDGSQAFNLQQSISKLQELANGKPIMLKTVASETASAPSPVVITAPSKEATSASPTSKVKSTSNTNKSSIIDYRDYHKHIKSLKQMQAESSAFYNKQVELAKQTRYAQRQAMYDELYKTRLGNGGPASIGTLNDAQRGFTTASNMKPHYMTSESGAPIYGSQFNEKTIGKRGGSVGKRVASGNTYDKLKTFMYPFTGNTSFGATTPMAVDMAKGMGTMFAIGGAMSAVSSSLHQSINYQNIMKTTEAILKNGTSNYSEQGFKQMEQVVRNVGKETKFTAPQVASAAKFLAMAGYDIPSVKSAITPVANLALIGDTNLGETADKMTNVMTTFGIEPEKMNDIADIMTSTFTRSNVDMMMLAESAKYAGGIAKMYGGNFKNNFSDTMAMFGVLGNAGIQASSAGTTVRMMYQNLMKPNKTATAAMKKYGIHNRDKNGNPLEITSIIQQLFDKVPKNKIADVVGDIFRITAQPGASTLIRAIGDGSLINLIKANREAAGTGMAQSIADEKKNTLSGLWAQVESTFTEGILQAVENREGGWAAMLIKIRDYLAKPETIQMLSSIVDLVEKLMGYMATFARIWTKVYHLFPGLINGWMQLQLLFTQFGMLMRPLIALYGVLDRFILRLNTAAAVTGASSGVSSVAGGAVAMTSGSVPRGLRYGAYIGSGKAKDNYLKYLEGYALWRATGNNYKKAANNSFNVLSNRLNNEIVNGSSAVHNTVYRGPGNAIYMRRKGLNGYIKDSEIASSGSFRAGQYRAAQMERSYAMAQGYKARYLNNLRQIRRPEQMANEALLRRYLAMDMAARSLSNYRQTSRSRLVAQRIEAIDAMRARNLEIAAARHANRTISPAVAARFNTMFAGRRTFGTAFKGGINTGLTAMSLAGTGASLKGALMSVVSGLGTALGALISPVGLAVTGIAALGGVAYMAYKYEKQRYEQSVKSANENAITAAKAREADVKYGTDIAQKYNDKIWGGKAPGVIAVSNDTPQSKQQKNAIKETQDKYKDALSATDQNTANRKFAGAILSNANALLGFGKDRNFAQQWHVRDLSQGNDNIGLQKTPFIRGYESSLQNSFAANKRAQASLRFRGAIAKETMNARAKIADLYEQKIAKKISENEFKKQALAIVNKTANPNKAGLLDTSKYTAEQIKKLNPVNTIAYQDAARQALLAELNGSMGSFVGKLEATEQLKSGVKEYTDGWYKAIGNLINGMQFSIQAGKETVIGAISTLPNGHIDVESIVAQVRARVENFNLTVTQFASMVSQVYAQLLNGGLVKGNYYRDWDNFVYNNTKNNPVTRTDAANYWDSYIGKGDPDVTWKGMDREEYIKAITQNKSGDGMARERVLLRRAMANTIANNAKRQYDKARQNAAEAAEEQKKQIAAVTGGKTVGTDGKKKKKKTQKDYENKYNRNMARPTQVIINIDKLANFDRTAIAKDSDERTIANAIETKIAEAVSMVSSQILTTASSTISQGLA